MNGLSEAGSLAVANIPMHLREFVSVDRDRIVTDSLKVGRHFSKQHKDVLRAYDQRECSTEFSRRNFAPSDYVDRRGKRQRIVYMTKDGFMFLVLGFTGAEAARIKEAYIAAFNAMDDLIRAKHEDLVQQLFETVQLDRTSRAKGSSGAYMMLERKAEKPGLEYRMVSLMAALQLALPFDESSDCRH